MKFQLPPLRKLGYFAKQLTRIDVLASIVISATILAVTWNTSNVILQNYQLDKRVREAQQKLDVAQLELDTQRLSNEYFKTDYFLDIATRKQLGKGVNGERLVIVPRSSALKEIPSSSVEVKESTAVDERSNIQKWLDFVAGKGI
jgi:hypothetical protein